MLAPCRCLDIRRFRLDDPIAPAFFNECPKRLASMQCSNPLLRMPRPLAFGLKRPRFEKCLPTSDPLLGAKPWIALGRVAVFKIRGALICITQARAAPTDGRNEK